MFNYNNIMRRILLKTLHTVFPVQCLCVTQVHECWAHPQVAVMKRWRGNRDWRWWWTVLCARWPAGGGSGQEKRCMLGAVVSSGWRVAASGRGGPKVTLSLFFNPPNRLHPVSRTFLTDGALTFNPEKQRTYFFFFKLKWAWLHAIFGLGKCSISLA